MNRNTYRSRRFWCNEPACQLAHPEGAEGFVSGFWSVKLTASNLGDHSSWPTRGDVRCPSCNSHNVTADTHIERMRSKPVRLRESDRVVVYKWHDDAGHEHYAYPSTLDTTIRPQRAGEERVEFDTLRSAERFLKTQDPWYNVRDSQGDIYDFNECNLAERALDETDPGLAEDVEAAVEQQEQGGSGVATEAEVATFMSQTSGQALIESI